MTPEHLVARLTAIAQMACSSARWRAHYATREVRLELHALLRDLGTELSPAGRCACCHVGTPCLCCDVHAGEARP